MPMATSTASFPGLQKYVDDTVHEFFEMLGNGEAAALSFNSQYMCPFADVRYP